MRLSGLHHITVLASDPQRNADFYTEVLGQRLVKRTVNFDAPDVYHLYYGDASGSPGTLMTFFPFPNAARGQRGSGEVSAVAYHAPTKSQDYWIHRLSSKGIIFDGPSERFGEQVISLLDPDGLKIELVFSEAGLSIMPWSRGPIPAEHELRGFHGVTMTVASAGPSETMLTGVLNAVPGPHAGNRRRFHLGNESLMSTIDIVVRPELPRARQSAGSVHHIAWRVHTDADQRAWQLRVAESGAHVTEIVDRQYFHSIYFREPGGVLYEIATDPPGMGVDEEMDRLGMKLQLPPWYEPDRARIERILPPIRMATAAGIVKN